MRISILDQPDLRRHLIPILHPALVAALPRRRFDVIVVGAGVAGLGFALRLPETLRVGLVTKGSLGESNTRMAQGGLSAAIGEDDSPDLHEEDTLLAGAGLSDDDTVDELVNGAPAAVEWLLSIGTRFDRDEQTGGLVLGREAAHSRRRVLHAGGDATGWEIERALVESTLNRPSIGIFPESFALDLVIEHGRCTGVVAELGRGAPLEVLEAQAIVMAAGGAGQLWATTSNPAGATGDGIAMALRANVAVADAAFVQFHPTVAAIPGTPPFLVSEAVRGEGAYLRNAAGERFMVKEHPLAELAPRDVVARGNHRQMIADGADHVFLDVRHLDAAAMRQRFPTITRALAERGLDLATDLIPVAPAAHYFMGGIVADTDGATSLPGLFALGEVSCTGVHGANRLASNSLLEGLVFGLNAANRVARDVEPCARPDPVVPGIRLDVQPSSSDVAPLRGRVQQVMSRHVAVVRDASGLAAAGDELELILDELARVRGRNRELWEARDLALAARFVTASASLRHESRGAHFRTDFPEPSPLLEGQHLAFGGTPGPVWRFSSLDAARGEPE